MTIARDLLATDHPLHLTFRRWVDARAAENTQKRTAERAARIRRAEARVEAADQNDAGEKRRRKANEALQNAVSRHINTCGHVHVDAGHKTTAGVAAPTRRKARAFLAAHPNYRDLT